MLRLPIPRFVSIQRGGELAWGRLPNPEEGQSVLLSVRQASYGKMKTVLDVLALT